MVNVFDPIRFVGPADIAEHKADFLGGRFIGRGRVNHIRAYPGNRGDPAFLDFDGEEMFGSPVPGRIGSVELELTLYGLIVDEGFGQERRAFINALGNPYGLLGPFPRGNSR